LIYSALVHGIDSRHDNIQIGITVRFNDDGGTSKI